MTRIPSDRPAGDDAPVTPAGPATSPASPVGDVAASGLPVSGPPKAGRPGAPDQAAGKNAAADGKVTPPRPAAGNDEAAQRREAQRAAWKAAETAHSAELRRRVLRPRRGGNSQPRYEVGGNRRMPPGGDAA